MSKVFAFSSSYSKFGVNLFFLGEGGPRPLVDDGEMNKGNKRIEGKTGASAMAELVATATNFYSLLERLPKELYYTKSPKQLYSDNIYKYLTKENLDAYYVYLIKEYLNRLEGLLPPNMNDVLSLIQQFKNKLEQLIGQQEGQQEQSLTTQDLTEEFAQLKEQILNAIAQSAQPKETEQSEQPEKPEQSN